MLKCPFYLLDMRTVNKSQLLGFYRFETVGDVRSTSRRVETFGNVGYLFDSDGYLKLKNSAEGDTTYSYARTGELLEVVKPDSTIISYTNDPMGRRVAKSINGEIVEKYLWLDRTTLLAIYDGQDNLLQKFNYADSRVPYSMEKDGSVYYLAYDQVGSLRVVSDSSGNIVKEISYDSFGNIITDTDPSFKVPFGFAGGLQDTDTNLVRFGYRDYDPNIGKWTARDPILFSGGDSNLYGYVLNDPINFVDSKGLEVSVIIWEPVGYGSSSFGHISTNINGTSYSWGPKGMDIRPYNNYKENQQNFRNGVGTTLNLTPQEEQKLENSLKNYQNNNSYNALLNNCGDPIEDNLQNFGFDIGNYVFPVPLFLDILNNAGKNSFNIEKIK